MEHINNDENNNNNSPNGGVPPVSGANPLLINSLPELEFLEDFVANVPPQPPQIIEGLLHQGTKMVLAGTSKTNKSWCLLDLALSVSSGQPWWGRRCTQLPVVYINFELPRWAIAKRLAALCAARPECRGMGRTLAIWNLRGRNSDLTLLRPMLERELLRHRFGLIILDPIYKLLGNRDENSNGEIAGLMNEIEALAEASGAAVALAHHFAKGDSTTKRAVDRMSGAGAWARDPDSILLLTPHEDPEAFTVTTLARNLPQVDDFVVTWEFPAMRLAPQLNPGALRTPQSRQKVCTDSKFLELIGHEPKSRALIVAAGQKIGLSIPTADRYLKRLTKAGLLACRRGTYWRKSS